ncbi:ABC transporter ATP-binding protein [Paenibacillus agri]|uniref:ABC transporter ATP-binding protein n=1 Tax=Paenibacillus agri TaxID=2744309 RepID=A0A850ER20_9BACL|nr:ABC transporter ATP-binding protein [Paenibacillus agri]NUU62189.1 ABC transporter ATP-binding protein [Paenibacillus agri]
MNITESKELKLGNVLRRLMSYARPYRIGFIVALLLLSARLVMDVGIAAVQQVFIDTINSSNMDALTRITVICAIVCVIIIFCLMLQHYFRFVIQSRMAWDIRGKLFGKSNRLPFQQVQSMHSGDLTSRNNQDAGIAIGMINSIVYDLGYNLLLCFISFLYLAKTDVWLALLALGSGPLVFLSGRFFDRRLRKLSTEIYAKEAELRGILQETLQGMAVVRAFSLEEILLDKYALEREKLRRMQLRRSLLNGLLWQSSAFINNIIMITCAALIALSALKGGTTAGGVLAFIILMGRVQWPFVHMSQTWGSVQEALGASDRVFAILDSPDEGNDHASPKPGVLPVISDEVAALQIQNVHYSYSSNKSNESPLFTGINVHIQHGETIAVVGPSGSGKTTLIRLCCGLYEPSAGSISVYGKSIFDQLEEARAMITYVPQSPYLFSGTIRDNIAYSSSTATDEEIEQAARLAGAEEFISKLPNGYDTLLGEHGSTLSGGQRQRIAIARAFLRNAPLLLLDEATSALDNESERMVQESLDLLMKDRTTLVIAHRLSTVREASRIIVLDQGAIVEEGTHDSLLERNGLYAQLYNIQFNASEQEGNPVDELTATFPA